MPNLGGSAKRHPCKQQCLAVRRYDGTVVVSANYWHAVTDLFHPRGLISDPHGQRNRAPWVVDLDTVNRIFSLVLRREIDRLRIGMPGESSNPLEFGGRQISLFAGLSVVEHEAEAVALVAGTLLGAVGDVASIGRVERRCVAGGIVGGNVLRFATGDRDDPQVVVGGSRRILVVIRGVANLFAVGREGVVVLPAERKHWSIVVAGGEVANGIGINYV